MGNLSPSPLKRQIPLCSPAREMPFCCDLEQSWAWCRSQQPDILRNVSSLKADHRYPVKQLKCIFLITPALHGMECSACTHLYIPSLSAGLSYVYSLNPHWFSASNPAWHQTISLFISLIQMQKINLEQCSIELLQPFV